MTSEPLSRNGGAGVVGAIQIGRNGVDMEVVLETGPGDVHCFGLGLARVTDWLTKQTHFQTTRDEILIGVQSSRRHLSLQL